MSLTPNVTTDIQSLRYATDKDLFSYCKIKNRRVQNICNSDSLWMLRILDRFRHLATNPSAPSEDVLEDLSNAYGQNIKSSGDRRDGSDPYWRNLYLYLISLPPNLTEAYIDLLINRKGLEYVTALYNKKLKDFSDRTGYKGWTSMEDPIIRSRFIETNKPIVLRPKIKQFVNEYILPAVGNQIEGIQVILNSYILATHGITTKAILQQLLVLYVDHLMDINVVQMDDPEEMLLEEGLDLISDDAAVPESELDFMRPIIESPELGARIQEEANRLNAAPRHRR